MSERQVLGWREWVALPALGIDRIKAKVDTGARTSALHADSIEVLADDRVRFSVGATINDEEQLVVCELPLVEQRTVRDSGGHEELRCVVLTSIRVGGTEREAEITLTSRRNMQFPMLLGRTTLRGQFVVDPSRSWLAGR